MRQISHRLLAAAVYDSLSAQTLPLPLETIKINYNAVNTAMIITWSLKRITYESSLWLRICQQDCLEAIRWPLMGHPHQANIWVYMTIFTAAAVFRFKLDCLLFHFVWDCSVVRLGIWGLNYCWPHIWVIMTDALIRLQWNSFAKRDGRRKANTKLYKQCCSLLWTHICPSLDMSHEKMWEQKLCSW